MTIAHRIAEWLARTDLDSVSETISARARICALDTVGVAMAGLEAPSVHAAARAFASDHGGYGFWGQPGSADLSGACFVNATATSALVLETSRGNFTETVHYPRGSTENPLPGDWLVARATAAIEKRLGARSSKQCAEDLLALDGLLEVGALARRLCAPA